MRDADYFSQGYMQRIAIRRGDEAIPLDMAGRAIHSLPKREAMCVAQEQITTNQRKPHAADIADYLMDRGADVWDNIASGGQSL